MKKTLITLAALAASVASAAVDPGFIVETAGNFYSGSYTLKFLIHDADDVSDAGTTLASYWGDNATAQAGQNWFTLTNTVDGITLGVGRGNGTTYYNGESISTFGTTLSVGTIYSVTSSGGSGGQNLSLYEGADTTGTAIATLRYNANMTDGGASTIMNTSFNKTFTIPEPTTATLSLLALAGLAARRRRK